MSKKKNYYVIRIEDWAFNNRGTRYTLVTVANTDSRIKTAIDKDFKSIARWYSWQFDEWVPYPAGKYYRLPTVERETQYGERLETILYYEILTKNEVKNLVNNWSEEYDEEYDEYFEHYNNNAKYLFKDGYFEED